MITCALRCEVGQYRGGEFILSELTDYQELIGELEDQGEDVAVTWPEGEPMRVAPERGTENLGLQLKSAAKNRFALDGELEFDDGLVVGIKVLLERLPRRKGRFAPHRIGQRRPATVYKLVTKGSVE